MCILTFVWLNWSFLIDKQSQVDIMATLRSDFCITRGEGLFAHTKYCDLYIHCTAQAVAITMECARNIHYFFNLKWKKKQQHL